MAPNSPRMTVPVDVIERLVAMVDGRESVDNALLDALTVDACEARGMLVKGGLVVVPYLSEAAKGA